MTHFQRTVVVHVDETSQHVHNAFSAHFLQARHYALNRAVTVSLLVRQQLERVATSGAPTKEGDSIGNSYLNVDVAASFIAQRDDEALMRRDKAPQRRTHHTAAAATTTWDLSSPSNAFLEQDTVDGELEMARHL